MPLVARPITWMARVESVVGRRRFVPVRERRTAHPADRRIANGSLVFHEVVPQAPIRPMPPCPPPPTRQGGTDRSPAAPVRCGPAAGGLGVGRAGATVARPLGVF